MIPALSLYDTRIDTNKKFVPMTIKIKLRNYVDKDGLSLLYLHVCSKQQRKRINLDIKIKPQYWDKQRELLKGPEIDVNDDNIIIGDIKSRINNIRKVYRLSSKHLTLDRFIDEFNNEMPRANFISFYREMLNIKKKSWHPDTYRKECSIYNKLKNWKSEILFCDIDQEFFLRYRSHLADIGNGRTTRNGNIKRIKKYLKAAEKLGVKLSVDLDDVIAGPTKGNRDWLNESEVKMCYDYFKSPFINESHKLVLGYFLFSCFTGLRISDVLQINRKFLKDNKYTLKNVKGDKTQVINLNKPAQKIIKKEKRLFIKFYSEKHINDSLKDIMKILGINKHVSFHVARHSFGTNYIRMGGAVTDLQVLLNHSDIKTTMIYVHMAKQEDNTTADLLNTIIK